MNKKLPPTAAADLKGMLKRVCRSLEEADDRIGAIQARIYEIAEAEKPPSADQEHKLMGLWYALDDLAHDTDLVRQKVAELDPFHPPVV